MSPSLTFVFLKYLNDKSSISACGRLPASVPVIGCRAIKSPSNGRGKYGGT